MFRKALFGKHGIRGCFVRVDCLTDSDIAKYTHPKKKLLPSKGKLRSEVGWLPTSSTVSVNSSEAISTLAVYHEQNDIVPQVARRNIRRQRAKSMFANRPNHDDQSNDMNRMKYSKDDMSELQAKFNSPNFGLKSSRDRSLGPKPQPPLSDWQKMFMQFKARVDSKLAEN